MSPTRLAAALILVSSAGLTSCATLSFDNAIKKVGPVGGVSLGATTLHDYEASPGDRVDDTDIGWAIWGGYQASPFWGAIAGYVNFGQLNAEGPGGGGFTDTIDYEGVALLGMGVLPVAPGTALVGLAGTFIWNQKVDYDDASGPFDADEWGPVPPSVRA